MDTLAGSFQMGFKMMFLEILIAEGQGTQTSSIVYFSHKKWKNMLIGMKKITDFMTITKAISSGFTLTE